jgi:hypothetical protein
MRIEINDIPPCANRYVTAGDWIVLPDGSLRITATEYGNENGAFLVALHELVEAWLCVKAGIREEDVSAWDIAHPDAEEPAEAEGSPYRKQHDTALVVERAVCEALGLDWDAHNAWVGRSADEVDRALTIAPPRITLEGSRYWAELHLFALRGNKNEQWLADWAESLPFEGCPCEAHFKQYMAENPPDWGRIFDWSIDLHNSVNDRIGRPTLSYDDARLLWTNRRF